MKVGLSLDFGFLFMLEEGDWCEWKKPGDGQAFFGGG